MKKQNNGIIGIYKITNPKGKVYIGQSIDIERREQCYVGLYSSIKGQPKIYNSIKKYGWENHKFEIIEECSIELLDEREIYWGTYYDSLNAKTGLNCKLGNSNSIVNEETRKKYSIANKGKKRTEETKRRMSQNSPFKGKPRLTETKLKISVSSKGIKKPGTGLYMKGMIWSDERKQKLSVNSRGKIRNNIPVDQFDLEGNFIKTWNSGTEAANFYRINQTCISDAIKGIRQKQSKGYLWKFHIS